MSSEIDLGLDRLHPEAKGIRLYKHTGRDNRLVACEVVMFSRGRAAVELTLRRASLAGRVQVEPFDGEMDFFADIFTSENEWSQTVLLDRGSYRSLKNHWMRCRLETE